MRFSSGCILLVVGLLTLYCAEFDNPADPANNGGFYGGVDSNLVGAWDQVGAVAYIYEPGTGGNYLQESESAIVLTRDSAISRYYFAEQEGTKLNAHDGQVFYYVPNGANAVYLYDYCLSGDGDTLYWRPEQTATRTDPRADSNALVLLRPWVRDSSARPDTGSTTITFDDSVDTNLIGVWDYYAEDGTKLGDSLVVASSDVVLFGTSYAQSCSTSAGEEGYSRIVVQGGRIICEAGQIVEDPLAGTSSFEGVEVVWFYYTLITDPTIGLDTLYLHGDSANPAATTPDVMRFLPRDVAVDLGLLGSWNKWDGSQTTNDYLFLAVDSMSLGGMPVDCGGTLHASGGQVWCKSGGERSYLYDYTLDGRVLYLVEDIDESAEPVNHATPNALILGGGEPTIESGLYGVWDEYDDRDSSLVAESTFIFTPSLFLRDAGTDTVCHESYRGLFARDGQIYCERYSDDTTTTWYYDYLLSQTGDTLWMDREIGETYYEPDPASARYLLVRKKDPED